MFFMCGIGFIVHSEIDQRCEYKCECLLVAVRDVPYLLMAAGISQNDKSDKR